MSAEYEYMPTTAVVRAIYGRNPLGAKGKSTEEAFDRWLEAHDAEVAARALRHAVPLATGCDGYAIRQRLLERADQIEGKP